jgi:hypothetical protein
MSNNLYSGAPKWVKKATFEHLPDFVQAGINYTHIFIDKNPYG